jgi:hypothetical protein
MNEATTIYFRIRITVAIVQRWPVDLESDHPAPAEDARAEPRTRQQHAATDPTDRSADG